MSEFDALNERASAAFESDQWSDEQDRSDWFESEAQSLAAKCDELESAIRKAWAALDRNDIPGAYDALDID